MSAVRYRFRAELRTKWKSVVAIALLAGVAGAVALAAVAGARRTDTAFALPGRAAAGLRPAAVLRSE